MAIEGFEVLETRDEGILKKTDLLQKAADLRITAAKANQFGKPALILHGAAYTDYGDITGEMELSINKADCKMLKEKFGDKLENVDENKNYKFSAKTTGKQFNGHEILALVVE